MPSIGKAAQQQKISAETWWSCAGRAIADNANAGHDVAAHIAAIVEQRQLEYANVEASTRFAAIARELADAAGKGRDTAPIITRLQILRRAEIGHPLTDHERDRLLHHEAGRTIGK